jgi:branched-chain amino acid transport system permease protein
MGYILTVIGTYTQMLIAGLGFHLLFSMGGVLFLAVPPVVMISAYTLAITQDVMWSFPLSLLLSLFVGILLSLFFILLHRRLDTDPFMIICLASLIGVESVLKSWTSLTNGINGIIGIPRPPGFESLEEVTLLSIGVALFAILIHTLWLQSKNGRFLRAQKEHPLALQSLGVSSANIVAKTILLAGLFFIFLSWLHVWKGRLITPTDLNIPFLIQLLTIGIIASKAKTRYVIGATALVVFIPELFRFLELPENIFAPLRSLMYSVLLIVLILFFRKKLSLFKRNI